MEVKAIIEKRRVCKNGARVKRFCLTQCRTAIHHAVLPQDLYEGAANGELLEGRTQRHRSVVHASG
jgi:hypothetical protein